MNICRFNNQQGEIRIGLPVDNQTVIDLTAGGVGQMSAILESANPLAELHSLASKGLPCVSMADVQFCAPVEQQEVWAAGVTYLRSKKARMEESDFSANAYDRVYDAERPELFFKSMPGKVVPNGEPVGIRSDAGWNVPEPELALVMNSRGKIVGHTIGNDMSARDIEGENLLYLPQAKTYHCSCALGPWITVGTPEALAREWNITVEIWRNGQSAFAGETSVGQIKRGFEELAGYLFRCQIFPHGAVLLTGTGIVPPESFTLAAKDEIAITISGIGQLRNPVVVV